MVDSLRDRIAAGGEDSRSDLGEIVPEDDNLAKVPYGAILSEEDNPNWTVSNQEADTASTQSSIRTLVKHEEDKDGYSLDSSTAPTGTVHE
jgi:hypothetical protein